MIRVGSVGYLNAAPLTDQMSSDRFEIMYDYPSAIARRLVAGEVDIGLVPVATVFENEVALSVLPRLCIGAEGAVNSVLLVGESPPETWTKILLDGVSLTSAALCKVLLTNALKSKLSRVTEVVTVAPKQALKQAGGTIAALVIGDEALTVSNQFSHRIDLAQAWFDYTGRPFVFAVWAVHARVGAEEVAEIIEAGERGIAQIHSKYAPEDAKYLTESIRYSLDDAALSGLRDFASMGYEAGLFKRDEFTLYGPQSIINRDGVGALFADLKEGSISAEGFAELLLSAPLELFEPGGSDAGTIQTRTGLAPGPDSALCDSDAPGAALASLHSLGKTGRLYLSFVGVDAVGQLKLARALTLASDREVIVVVNEDQLELAELAAAWGHLPVLVLSISKNAAMNIELLANPKIPGGATRPPQKSIRILR